MERKAMMVNMQDKTKAKSKMNQAVFTANLPALTISQAVYVNTSTDK